MATATPLLWTSPGLLAPEPPRPIPPPPPRPNVVWIGSPNCSRGRAGMTVIALVVHTMAGSLRSCDAWFSNPAAQVSSQYGIGLEGQIHQYVQLGDTAWANGILESGNSWPGLPYNVNQQTVSIETEDLGSGATPVSNAQYASTLAVCQLALRTFPSITWLLGHHCISPSSRPSCPGARWRDSGRFTNLAVALGLEPMY